MTHEPNITFVICEINDDGTPRSSIGSCVVVSQYINRESAEEAAKVFTSKPHHEYQRKTGAFKLESLA